MAVTLEDQQVKLSPRARNANRELRKLRAQIDELTEKADAKKLIIQAELAEHLVLGAKVVGTVGGVPVVSISSSVRRSLNNTLLRKRVDKEIIDECTTESEVRTFKILGEE